MFHEAVVKFVIKADSKTKTYFSENCYTIPIFFLKFFLRDHPLSNQIIPVNF